MKKIYAQDMSFEYKPVETEMGNYDEGNSDTSDHKNKVRFSQIKDETEEEKSIYYSIGSNRQNESIESLQSLRISRPVSGKRDNEKTLLERMNLFHSSYQNEERPNTLIKKGNNKIIISNIFDDSNTMNKKVMISDLDIETNNNIIVSTLEGFTQSTLLNTITGDNPNSTAKETNNKIETIYQANSKGIRLNTLNTLNTLNSLNTLNHINNTVSENPDNKNHNEKTKLFSIKNRCDRNKQRNQKTKTFDSKPKSKKKNAICSSIKRINFNKTIHNILQKINEKQMSVFKNKTSSTPQVFQKNHLINKSSQPPFDRNKKADAYMNMLYNKTTQVTRTNNSFKQKNMLNKELSNPKNNVLTCKDGFTLNRMATNENEKKAVRHKTISKPKDNKNKDKDYISFNYSIFQTIQSIKNQKVKKSLMNTISNKKASSKAFYSSKPVGLSKIKRANLKSPTNSKSKNQQVSTMYSHLDTNYDRSIKSNHNNTFHSYNNKIHLHTPTNTKSRMEIYKTNIVDKKITPLDSLKMSILQYHNINSLKTSKNNDNSDYGVSKHKPDQNR